jgi:hypothetical protein
MAIRALERPPGGLREPWLGLWRASLYAMQAQGTWTPAQRPLLDLYISALEAASEARKARKSTVWDREARKALILAGQLALTPRGRRAAGVSATTTIERPDPFAALDPARRKR